MRDQIPIKALIVDDHLIVRKGTQALLAQVEDIEVVGEATNGREAIAQASALRPDVILMDLLMPEMGGIEAIHQISARHPEIRILALTSFAADDLVFPAIKAGAIGYLLKDVNSEDLIDAIRKVHRGEPSLHPNIARRVLQMVSKPVPKKPTPEPLTKREVEVLQLVAGGLNNRQIAEHLAIAEVTVRTHVSNILHKLHLANRVLATLYALREGMASIEDDSLDDRGRLTTE